MKEMETLKTYLVKTDRRTKQTKFGLNNTRQNNDQLN